MLSQNKIQPSSPDPTGVVVTGGITANALGIVRSFGRRGIPVVYIDSDPGSFVRHSRYINRRLTCKKISDSESDFISLFKDFAKQENHKMMIIPVGDEALLALSRHRDELEQFYHLPVPRYETAQKLVNKKRFYLMLSEIHLPHPKTYFPEGLAELVSLGKTLAFPYIIKPAYSIPFQEEFGRKVFQVKSPQDLHQAADKLRDKDMDVMIQEIIPGRALYAFFTISIDVRNRWQFAAGIRYGNIPSISVSAHSARATRGLLRPTILSSYCEQWDTRHLPKWN